MGPGPGLLERGGELATLSAALAAASEGRGGVVFVEGPAGVGKTALLRELAARGRNAGARVLTASGSELEREYPFGMVRQLLEAEVLTADDERQAALLSGASALAGRVLGAATLGTDSGQDSSFATLHGCYWLVVNLSEASPLLLVLDDAHWSDAASLRFVDFLARRVSELPVLVALGVRSGERGAEGGLLDAIADADDAIGVRPRPLSAAGTQELVSSRLGDRATGDVADAAFAATRGNPLLLSELARALAEGDGVVTADAVEAVVPSSVSRSVQRRLARLPEDTRRVARALAVLGDRVSSELLAVATSLPPTVISEALEQLRDCDLVSPEGSAFAHPLVRQAVADGVGAGERHRWHAATAQALHERGHDPEEVIVHLLAGPPVGAAWARDVLREGARRSLAEGVPDSAARRLARAIEETGDDEQPELALELGEALLRAGDPAGIAGLTVAARAEDPVISARAVMSIVQAQSLSEDFDATAVGTRLRVTIDRLGPSGPLELRDALMGALVSASTLNRSLLTERRAVVEAGQASQLPVLIGLRAFDGACGDMPADEVRSLAEASIAAAPFDRLREVESAHAWWPNSALYLIDAFEAANLALTTAEETARRHGSRLGRAWVQTNRSFYAMHAGAVALAEATARESIELWRALGFERVAMTSISQLAGALALRGELAEAEHQLALCAHEEVPFTRATMLIARARVGLARRRPGVAVNDLREVQQIADALGQRRFWGHCGLQLAFALIAAGELDEARAVAREDLDVADRADRPSLRAGSLTALGLALPGTEGLAALEHAATTPSGACVPIIAARARLEYGAALRRAGHASDARRWLRESHEIASGVDLRSLAERAHEELIIAGGRPRSRFSTGVESLTPSERRVADHAAAGLSNREIAETLFVTRKTVELHLGNVYGKLGIRSRTQLPDALQPVSESL